MDASMTEQMLHDMNRYIDDWSQCLKEQAKLTDDKIKATQKTIFKVRKSLVENNRAYDQIMRQYEQDVPSIHDQTGWETGIWDLPTKRNQIFFNPTCIEFNGQRWLVTRDATIETHKQPPFNTFSQITIFPLTDTQVTGQGITIKLPKGSGNMEQWEDPRILWSGHQLWLSCCNFVQGKTGAHQAFAILDANWEVKGLHHPVYGDNGPAVHLNKGNEKNWLWFKHDGVPHMVYQNEPHEVVRMTPALKPAEVYETSLPEGTDLWHYHTRRGGTNPILIGDEYWSFFHSSTPWWNGRRRYHMGAYAFQSKPPFAVTRYTPMPLLSGSLRDPRIMDFPVVVFPGGHIYDETKGEHFVVMGINDCKCGWIKIPHLDLLEITLDVYEHKKKKFKKPEAAGCTRKVDPDAGGLRSLDAVEEQQNGGGRCKQTDEPSCHVENAPDCGSRKPVIQEPSNGRLERSAGQQRSHAGNRVEELLKSFTKPGSSIAPGRK